MATPPNTMTAFTDLMRVHATDLTPMVGNINDLYANQLNNGYFSRYSASATIPGSAVMTPVTPSLLEGAGTGLVLAGNLFTLGAGVWDVKFGVRLTRAVNATDEVSIAMATDATSGDTGVFVGSSQTGATTANMWFVSVAASIRSATGTAQIGFKWSWSNASSVAVAQSRITFMRQAGS